MSVEIPIHFMRYGYHAEKNFFNAPLRDCYGGIALNGNLVAYSPKGVSSFLSGLLSEKPYFIDPVTHAFGHSLKDISKLDKSGKPVPKAAIKKLAEEYQEPVLTNINSSKSTRPDDFTEVVLAAFVTSVLAFQKNAITDGLRETGDDKYIEQEEREPIFLIAPYFYLSSNTYDLWLDTNLRLVEESVKQSKDIPVFTELLVESEAFIDPGIRELLLDNYAGCSAQGVILWVEDFSEHAASPASLSNYRNFISELSDAGKNVLIAYGGYYSVILTSIQNVSVCHGPGYGEDRKVTPVGGGISRPKYYYPKLHDRIPFREVAYALAQAGINDSEAFFERVCRCETCHEVIQDDLRNFAQFGDSVTKIRSDGVAFEYATTAAKAIAVTHYIFNKKAEFDYVANNNLDDMILDLRDSYDKCSTLFDVNEAAHLRAWAESLQS